MLCETLLGDGELSLDTAECNGDERKSEGESLIMVIASAN